MNDKYDIDKVSPRPWKRNSKDVGDEEACIISVDIHDADGKLVATTDGEHIIGSWLPYERDAAHIVHCVNEHDHPQPDGEVGKMLDMLAKQTAGTLYYLDTKNALDGEDIITQLRAAIGKLQRKLRDCESQIEVYDLEIERLQADRDDAYNQGYKDCEGGYESKEFVQHCRKAEKKADHYPQVVEALEKMLPQEGTIGSTTFNSGTIGTECWFCKSKVKYRKDAKGDHEGITDCLNQDCPTITTPKILATAREITGESDETP